MDAQCGRLSVIQLIDVTDRQTDIQTVCLTGDDSELDAQCGRLSVVEFVLCTARPTVVSEHVGAHRQVRV